MFLCRNEKYSSITSMAWFKLVFESLGTSSYSSRKHIFRDISRKFSYHENVCCVYLLELPHWGNSNEYKQDNITLLKVEKASLNYLHLSAELALWLTLSGSNYQCPEQIFVVQKMFEPLLFDCVWIPPSHLELCSSNHSSSRGFYLYSGNP